MNPRHALMALALAVAGYLALFADKQPDPGVAAAISEPSRGAASAAVVVRAAPALPLRAKAISPERGGEPVALLAWQPREPFHPLGEPPAERQTPFAPHDWSPPPPPPAREGPPAPPQAPPLPYAYLGKQWQGGAWEVYLAMGDEVRIARVGSVLDARYRVASINPPHLNLVYLPLKQAQSLDIGAPQ